MTALQAGLRVVGSAGVLAGAASAAIALAACFVFPDGADLRVETDQPEYVRDTSAVPIVITMRNAGGGTTTLSGTDHLRIDVELFDDGRWQLRTCLGCFALQPPSEVSLELGPGATHIDTVEAGSWWRAGHYRIAVPYRSAGKPREPRRAYSRVFEIL